MSSPARLRSESVSSLDSLASSTPPSSPRPPRVTDAHFKIILQKIREGIDTNQLVAQMNKSQNGLPGLDFAAEEFDDQFTPEQLKELNEVRAEPLPLLSHAQFKALKALTQNDKKAQAVWNLLGSRYEKACEGNLFALLSPLQCKKLRKAYGIALPKHFKETTSYVDHLGERVVKFERDVAGGHWQTAAIVTSIATCGVLPLVMQIGKWLDNPTCRRFMKTLTEGTVKGPRYEKLKESHNQLVETLYDPTNTEDVQDYFTTHEKEVITYRGHRYLINEGGRVIIANPDGTIQHVTFAQTHSDEYQHGKPIENTKENNYELTRLVKSWIASKAQIRAQAKDADTFLFDYHNRQVYAVDSAHLSDSDAMNLSHEKFKGKKLELPDRQGFWHNATRLKDKDEEEVVTPEMDSDVVADVDAHDDSTPDPSLAVLGIGKPPPKSANSMTIEEIDDPSPAPADPHHRRPKSDSDSADSDSS